MPKISELPQGTITQSTLVAGVNGGVTQRVNVPIYESLIIVRQASDLAGTLDSNKLYMVDGMIDMVDQSIEVPEGGLSFAGLNGSREVFGLYSTENNYTMFVSPSGGYSGNVLGETMTVYVTGTNSQVFDLDNDNNNGAFEFNGINFGGFGSMFCTSLGSVSNYRQFFMAECGIYNVKDGLTMNGSWSGLVFTNSNVLGADAFTLFKEGTGLTFDGSIRSNANFGASAGSLNAASVFMDFDEANILQKGGVSLINFRTSVTNAVPNLPSASSYVRYSSCSGIRNTYVGGQSTITAQSATLLNVTNPNKMAGTTFETDLQWFTDGGDNRLVYDGDQEIEVECKGVISVSGSNNDQANLFFRQRDVSAGSWIDAPKAQATLNGGLLGTRAEGVPFFGYFTLNNGDYIEVWIENDGDTNSITALNGGLISIVERAS